MLRDDDVVLIISNAPDLLLAKRIAHVLVEDGLAACVNLGAPGLSIYMWQGEVEGAEEVPIHIKTTYARHAAVVAALAQMHPYDVPEIIVLPVIGGAAPWTGCANRRPSCRTRETDVAICRYGWRRALRPSRTDLARRLFALLALALLWLGWNATSRAEAEFLDPEKAFVFSAAMSAPDSVELRYRVAPGYYMYRERFGITISPYGAATLGEAVYPKGEVKYDPTFEKDMEVYHQDVIVRVPVQPGGQAFTLTATSQGCADAGLCYPPMDHSVKLTPCRAATPSRAARWPAPARRHRPAHPPAAWAAC